MGMQMDATSSRPSQATEHVENPGVVVRGTALRAAPRLTAVRHGWASDAFAEVPWHQDQIPGRKLE